MELRKQRKKEKARKEAERIEEINKNLDLKVAVRVGELRDDVREDVRLEIRGAINELCKAAAKGKQKVTQPTSPSTRSSGSGSEMEKLSKRTKNLCINEKRKRAEEPIFEDSPPMELPPKRTPRRAGKPTNLTSRMTRSKAHKNNVTTPRKTPTSIRKKKIPGSIGMIGRLKFEKQVMQELKNMDALVLQNVCSEKGIPYNGKFEAIFDIVVHRTRKAYGTDEEESVETTDDVLKDDAVEGEVAPTTE
ncbi:hypothetical protein CBR_g4594 [Chara braunii]|uniref:Uncharacterized protein n=1 Tax=Chara braunii TaxID=69332 RepID=A0A388KIH0_CHABU|nr:hypothetical protein CBR_g4594 [Chara braunii]|eukprot:GBG69763.1 hypothetical protein CBR_g4594 [Chara braunii]